MSVAYLNLTDAYSGLADYQSAFRQLLLGRPYAETAFKLDSDTYLANYFTFLSKVVGIAAWAKDEGGLAYSVDAFKEVESFSQEQRTSVGSANFAIFLAGAAASLGRAGAALTPITGADECDRQASHPLDPLRRAPGVQFEKIDVDAAYAACKAAVDAAGSDTVEMGRAVYELARTLTRARQIGTSARYPETSEELLARAVDLLYPMAFNNMALELEDRSEQDTPQVPRTEYRVL